MWHRQSKARMVSIQAGGWAGWMVTICRRRGLISSGRAWMLTIRWLGRLDGDHLPPQRLHQQRKGLDADHPVAGQAGW
jgi:hypothetical protein